MKLTFTLNSNSQSVEFKLLLPVQPEECIPANSPLASPEEPDAFPGEIGFPKKISNVES